jgi:hypothetical protein
MGSSCRPWAWGPPASKEASTHAAGCAPLPARLRRGRRLATVAWGMLSVPVLRACPDRAPEASRIRPHREEKTT